MSDRPLDSATADPNRASLKIAGLYLLTAGVWILASDQLASAIVGYSPMLTTLSMLKGWAFVVVTALLLYWLIRRYTDALSASAAHYRRLVDLSPDATIVHQDGRIVFVNRAGARLFAAGVADALIDKPLQEVIRADFWKETQDRAARALQGEAVVYPVELYYVRTDGTTFPAEIMASSLLYQGRPATQVVVRDITERKLAEETLRKSEERHKEVLRLFVEHAPAGIAMLDRDMRYVVVSRRYITDYRLGDQDLVGRSHYEVFPEIPERWKEIHRRCLAGAVERSEADPFPRADGRVDWSRWEIRPWYEKTGAIGGIILFSEVITDRKHAEETLIASETRYRSLFENMHEGFAHCRMIWDNGEPVDFVYLDVNAAFGQLTGLQDVVGRPVSQVIPGLRESNPELLNVYGRVASSGRPDRLETYIPSLGIWLSIAAYSPKPGHFVAVFDNITERKEKEKEITALNAELEQRVHARTAELDAKNRELETFTYSVSHDLKAPLRGIDGYSRLLLEGYADKVDDDGRFFLRTIRQATEVMSQLIDDLLAYSRLERRTLSIGQVHLPSLAQGLLAQRADEIAARHVGVTVQVPDESVAVDTEGLTLVLRNLLDNALKFTRDVPEPQIEIGGQMSATTCLLWVRDNGVGFDMQFHDRIYEIFQRLHRPEDYPGTGVGLAIVRKAMERMRGRVWASSAPNAGATFFLELTR